MPSNISGRSNTTVYVNTVSCDLPLNLSTNNSSSSTINLGGLNSYGGAGKVMTINSSNDGLEWGDKTDTIYSAGTNINISGTTINLDSTVSINRLNMNYTGDGLQDGNPIYFKGNNDPYHYIKFVRDGLQIAGYGNGGACISIYSTGNDLGATPEVLADYFRDLIQFNKDLYMNDKALYLHIESNGTRDTNHYIKYQSVGDCVELASYSNGANDDVVFQFINKAVAQGNNPNLLLINKENNSIIKDTYFESDIIIKNAKKLIFQDSSVISQNNYIKFNNTYDSMEISGSGLGGTASVLRIVSANATPDVLAEFELTKITFEKTTYFNNDIQMELDKKLFFNVGLLSNNNWIKATTEDNQPIGLNIQGDASIKLTTETFSGELFLNGNTLAISANLTTFDNDITATFCDISLDGDFVGTDCDLTIDGDMRIGQDLNMRDNTNLGQINMADGAIYYRNGYKTGTNTYATDTNHYSQYIMDFPLMGYGIKGGKVWH
jgi:hypothetical protein